MSFFNLIFGDQNEAKNDEKKDSTSVGKTTTAAPTDAPNLGVPEYNNPYQVISQSQTAPVNEVSVVAPGSLSATPRSNQQNNGNGINNNNTTGQPFAFQTQSMPLTQNPTTTTNATTTTTTHTNINSNTKTTTNEKSKDEQGIFASIWAAFGGNEDDKSKKSENKTGGKEQQQQQGNFGLMSLSSSANNSNSNGGSGNSGSGGSGSGNSTDEVYLRIHAFSKLFGTLTQAQQREMIQSVTNDDSFDLNKYIHNAKYVLEHDQNVAKIRSQMVPLLYVLYNS